MSTLMQRFAKLKELRPDITKADLARATGAKPPSVGAWFDGGTLSMKGETAAKAAALYGVSAHWLATGDGPMGLVIQDERLPPATSKPNVEEHASRGAVPRISWVQAGCWADVADPFQPGEAEEWLPCPVKHGPRTYCLTVRGQSMFNPEGRPSYAEGDIIFVDPDRDANHGDRVIVRLDDQQEATFKQLLIEDGRKLLKALNPNWPERYMPINGNATICGVIIGKWVPE